MNYISSLPPSDWIAPETSEPRKQPLLARLMHALRRRRRVSACVALAAFVMIFLGALLQPVKYSATSLIIISPGQAQIVAPEQSLTDDRADSAAVETALEVFRSPYLARRLAVAAKLQSDPRWVWRAAAANQKPGIIDDDLVNKVMRAISVHRRSVSNVVEVTVKAPTARQAAEMANSLVTLYQAGREELRAGTILVADSWLNGRLDELRADVQHKELAIADYRAKNGLLNSGENSLTELQISNIQASVLSAEADLAEKTARYDQAANATRRGAGDTLGSALSSDTMRELRAREADLTRRQADLENRYTSAHPLVQTGRAELANIHSSIKAELSRIAANAANEVTVARSRRDALVANLNNARNELITDNSALVAVHQLEREAAASRAVYESFLKRFQEIAQQSKLGPSDAVMLSAAHAPNKPTSPNMALAFLMAVVIGCVLGVAASFVVDRLHDALDLPDELQHQLKLPIVGSIPFVTPRVLNLLDPSDRSVADYFVAKPLTRFAESYRMLRAGVEIATPDLKTRVIAVTSAVADEGKSTTALCLVRAAALAGKRAILVDCDLRNPSLAKVLGIAPLVGLREVLSGASNWHEVVGSDPRTGAHVIPAAETDTTPAALIESAPLHGLIEELRLEYDFIVLNCAPVLLVAETIFIAPLADVVLVVAHWERASRAAVAAAIEQLSLARVDVMRIVLNCMDFHDWNGGLRSDGYYTPNPPSKLQEVERLIKGLVNAAPAPS